MGRPIGPRSAKPARPQIRTDQPHHENPQRECITLDRTPRRSVRWRTLIAVVPRVLDPFQYVAVHVVKAKGIGAFLANWLRFDIRVATVPGMLIELRFIVTERE